MYKDDPTTIKKWMTTFNNCIVPYMCKNNMSLHEAFEDLRQSNRTFYDALSGLWHTYTGKTYLKDFMSKYGNRFSTQTLKKIKEDHKK